jgi:hypothetical protein
MATKSKSTKKKATSKKAPAPAKAKKDKSGESREERKARLTAALVELINDEGKTINSAADALGIDPATANWLYTVASVKPKDRIKGSDEEVAARIVELRDVENTPWHHIAARAGLSISKTKAIYTETTGEDANQGHIAAQRRAAARAEAEPKKVKAKTGSTKATSKDKAKNVTKSRKAKKGTANPSKG